MVILLRYVLNTDCAVKIDIWVCQGVRNIDPADNF